MGDKHITYEQLVLAGAASLKPGEKWMIGHPDGLLEMTASDDFTWPVKAFCEATGLDWDEAKEQGYCLVKAAVS